MEFKMFIIGITILYLVLGFTVLGWFAWTNRIRMPIGAWLLFFFTDY